MSSKAFRNPPGPDPAEARFGEQRDVQGRPWASMREEGVGKSRVDIGPSERAQGFRVRGYRCVNDLVHSRQHVHEDALDQRLLSLEVMKEASLRDACRGSDGLYRDPRDALIEGKLGGAVEKGTPN